MIFLFLFFNGLNMQFSAQAFFSKLRPLGYFIVLEEQRWHIFASLPEQVLHFPFKFFLMIHIFFGTN